MDHTQIVLVQRQTVDWLRLSDAGFHQQSKAFCKLWGKPEDYIWQLFQLWNSTFAIDYRVVRQQLKDLSLRNFQQAEHVTFSSYENYKNIARQSGYYIFLDDDDWVDPEISIHLQQQLKSFPSLPPLLLWRSANIGSPNQEHVVFIWGMNGRCMTNNYAVHSFFLQPFSKIYDVLQHKDAATLIDKQKNIPHLDCALTASNKSPISSVSLDRGLDGDLSSERLIELVENYLDRMHKVQHSELVYIPWSRPLIKNMIEIFEKIFVSRKS